MTYSGAYGTVVDCIICVLAEEVRLKNACREDYDNLIKIRICINLLWVHLPEHAIYGLAYSVYAVGPLWNLNLEALKTFMI